MTAPPATSPPNRPRSAPRAHDGVVAGLAGDDFDRDVWCILGLPIDAADIPRAVEAVETAVRARRRLSFVTPNVNWLVRALRDAKARRQVLNADLSLADGAPLVAVARLLGAPITRAAGSDVFEALALRPGFPGRRIRVFFFGGREGSAKAAHAALARAPSGLEAAGWLNPGFGDAASMSSEKVIAEINAAAPDFVVVALGAAKGQDWIEANQHRLAAPAIAHLGAVVDFAAGAVRRAPPLIAAIGLEWAWRIAEEPALWRRYGRDALSLWGILATRFAPQVFLGRGRGRAEAAAEAAVERRADGLVVHLSGALAHGGLSPVRAAFRQAAAAGGPVILDFTNVRSVDRAFLGLVLMLEKTLPAGGLKTAAASRPLAALLAANAMAYPVCEIAPAAPQDEPGRARAAAR